MAISKRLRYEVLRRDNHACRYCGASAPDAKLTIDHVVPVALGGGDQPGNLVTACPDCNSGKSASSPDAAIVADVSADAIRWGRALARAADIQLRDLTRRTQLQEEFRAVWDGWEFGRPPNQFCIDLPAGWQSSVDTILAAGLPIEVLCECVDIAMGAAHIKPSSTFRYMCGIAWRKVTGLREIAGALLEADQET